MNISTGGPHILLFERDQQLAMLLTSELQLAGYECHTARTAVEVFDAIARNPIRLVLVNMAQAAAARREFWVALDTQRRGSGVQVFTFHCTNLAGYGPRDPEEQSAAMADMEVDGMFGLMSLVDAVRVRVPGPEANASTMPRLPRTPPASQRSSQQPQQGGGSTFGSGTGYRTLSNRENTGSYAARSGGGQTAAPSASSGAQATTTQPLQSPPLYSSQATTSGVHQPVQSEKIRAVLYPNQRTWSSQENSPIQPEQDAPVANGSGSQSPTTPDASILQRLAGVDANGQKESGLAQLSRLVQGYRESDGRGTAQQVETPYSGYTAAKSTQTQQETFSQNTTMANVTPISPRSSQMSEPSGNTNHNLKVVRPTQAAEQTGTSPGAQTATRSAQGSENSTINPAPPSAQTVASHERISSQPLRAAPIQDLPLDRVVSGAGTAEAARRPDVLTRTNYGQQQAPQAAAPTQSPLASIATALPNESRSAPSEVRTGVVVTEIKTPAPVRETKSENGNRQDKTLLQDQPEQQEQEAVYYGKEKEPPAAIEPTREPRQEEKGAVDGDEGLSANNAVILDILQSLPPMPAVAQPQTVQAQPLNGRATRTLGSVLLDGHLVPQDRLEVAQNIQRMLRGVDLNYQLGEILLMFKLLTPDQLLAAGLVSYGLITTTQISALGRIRQELHSIGLEYDLENLLILFRILTPEQLREVRASFQG